MGDYVVTARKGPKVERERFEDFGQALAAVERHVEEMERTAHARATGGRLIRRFEPVQQVVGRVEVRGPDGVRGGIDVRGDSSSEAYTGRFRRTLVEQLAGESPSAALRRALRA
ncbi:MAG TPA: hypothetical protein VHF90_10750 [Thermoleophilaceae bacterium]|nr:hypothetical protein [Thermoleophilaceae bacterium]